MGKTKTNHTHHHTDVVVRAELFAYVYVYCVLLLRIVREVDVGEILYDLPTESNYSRSVWWCCRSREFCESWTLWFNFHQAKKRKILFPNHHRMRKANLWSKDESCGLCCVRFMNCSNCLTRVRCFLSPIGAVCRWKSSDRGC